ncbi:putative nuclease HARBI1 [Phymastichus coffea]|uniref:putative nuclease HARBI1 n=1 Tax=Phymastichus coffea TaxID=108790 RepID=UPI00273C4E37|nr:putative nuclease HARBI1 [Phymastichus coffea]XP_058789665.1 putative nuclease HARBI1 [Phymastichus coffea]
MSSDKTLSKQSNVASDNDSNWWFEFVNEDYSTEKCLQLFKCSRRTYMFLVKTLKPHISPKFGALPEQDSLIQLRKGITVEKQVAIFLFKLTTSSDYTTISKKFKIHKTTIHKIVYKCIVAVNRYLLHKIINMPKDAEAQIIASDFEQVYKIPQIIGAMAIVHVPISSPINLNYQFLNSKLYPSFVMQVVVDSNFRFRDVSVRHAGAAELRLILAESNLYKYSQKVMPTEEKYIDGINVSYKIIGPTEGPLYSWLLNNYTIISSPKEALFNKRLDEIRNYVETVITRLRSRFLILSRMMDLSYKVAPQLIAACCILNNICETEDDAFLEEWSKQSAEFLKKYPQPEMKANWEQASEDTLRQRDVLKDYIYTEETEND